jgi:hypothetical protein
MNGFFSNLAARSFDRADGPEWVRPRLPSLFEKESHPGAAAPSENSGNHGEGQSPETLLGGLNRVPRVGDGDWEHGRPSNEAPFAAPGRETRDLSATDMVAPARPREDDAEDVLSNPPVSVQPSNAAGTTIHSLSQSVGIDARGETSSPVKSEKPERWELPGVPSGFPDRNDTSAESRPPAEAGASDVPGTSDSTRQSLSLDARDDRTPASPPHLPGTTGNAGGSVSRSEDHRGFAKTEEVFRHETSSIGLPPRGTMERTFTIPRVEYVVRQGSRLAHSQPVETATDERPSIRVTIGRVEVRAVTEQRPAAPKEKTMPALGLDEYLNPRRKGTR